MARTGKLSAVEVAKARELGVLHDGGGLYLRVSPTGSKSWVFRFQIDGRPRHGARTLPRYFARGGTRKGYGAP